MQERAGFILPPFDPILGFWTHHRLKAYRRIEFMTWLSSFGKYVQFSISKEKHFLMTDPDAVEQILVKNNTHFNKDIHTFKMLEKITGAGIFTENSDDWKNAKEIIAPHFVTNAAGKWREEFDLTSESIIKEISQTNEYLDPNPLMTKYALHSLGQVIFNLDLSSKVQMIQKQLGGISGLINFFILPHPILVPFKIIEYRRKMPSFQKNVDNLIQQLIDVKKQDPDQSLVNDLIQYESYCHRENLALNQIKTLIFAGHETTATVLVWCIHFLSLHESWQSQLYEELREIDPIKVGPKVTPLLESTIKESMRMFPPAWSTGRRALYETSIMGRKIYERDVISLNPYLMGRDQDFWEHPESFFPERFLGLTTKKPHRYSFIPFLVGDRGCLGAAFSMMETRILLAKIIQEFVIITKQKQLPPKLQLTLTPSEKVLVRFKKRSR